MKDLRDEVRELTKKWSKDLEGVSSKSDVDRYLKSCGLFYEDDSKEYGYPNFHVPIGVAYTIRIYKGDRMKTFKVQLFEKVELKYSGIPVFEPSGRRSF